MGKALKTILAGVVIGALTVFTGGGAAGLFGALTSGIGSALGIGAVAAGAIAGGLSFGALYGLSGLLKPKLPTLSDEFGRELQLNGDPVAPRKFIYGEVWTAGTLRYRNTTGSDNENLYLVMVLAGHEVDSVQAVEADGQALTLDGSGNVTAPSQYAGLMNVRFKLGGVNQTVDTTLDTAFSNWTSNHRLRGLAYAIVQLTFDEENLNSVPQFRFKVRGRKVYDPRLDSTNGGSGSHRLDDDTTWAWTDNAVLCGCDFVRGVRLVYGSPAVSHLIGGIGVTDARVSWPNVIAEANVCEEAVTLDAGGTQDRYTVNGVIDPRQDHGTNLRHFEFAIAGDITFADGKWRFFAGAYRTPTLHLTDTHFIGPLRHTVHKGASARVDTAQGVFASAADSGSVLDYPPVRLASAVIGQERTYPLDFALITNSPRAQRCAKILLERESAGKQITCTTSLYGYRAVSGETIQITHAAFGLTAQDMRVIDVQLTTVQQDEDKIGLAVELMLEAGPASLYSWNAEETAIAAAPTLAQAQVPFLFSIDGIGSGLTNPGFETGTLRGWTSQGGTWSVDSTDPMAGGTYGAVCSSSTTFMGLRNDARLQVSEGDRVLAQGYVQRTGSAGLEARAVSIRIQWFDDTDTVIQNSSGNSVTGIEYAFVRAVAKAPADAVTAAFQFYSLGHGGDPQGARVDGAFMAMLPQDADLATIDAEGQLREDIAAGDGTTYRSVARGPEAGSARDGDSITFDPAWSTIPTVKFGAGGVSFSPTLNNSQAQDFQALNLSGSGFTAYLKIKELAGSSTLHTDTTVSDPSSPSGLDYSINKSQSAEAFDDRYTFQYDVTVTNFQGGAEPGDVTVGLYTNDGSGWVLRATRFYSGTTGESSTTRSNQTYTVTVDGLGLNDDFGINIESGLGSINFDSVKYETATAPATESATPSGSPSVSYVVVGG